MAEEIAVSTGALAKAAQANVAVQTTLQGILTTLQNNVAARGTPWGDDSYGSKFYDGPSGYGQVEKTTMTNAGNLSETFGQTGHTLTEAATGIDTAESVSSDSFDA